MAQYYNYCLPLFQQTALHLASKGGHGLTVQFLVDNGADVNIKDDCGVSETLCYAGQQ